mgnify:CR=1 FL=1
MDKIVITNVPIDFKALNLEEYPTDGKGIYYIDEQSESLCRDIDSFKCAVKNCKDKDKRFPSFIVLKKHLKDEHNRVMCEVCLKHSAATIDEQKLFTPGALNNHLMHGDYDENGNLVLYHPYCKFCKVNYFNDDLFGAHLKQDHFKCHVCDKKYQYYFYDKYQNLQTHFEKSHYACLEPDCLEKCFIVFKTKNDFEVHLLKTHKSQAKQVKAYLVGSMEEDHAEHYDNEGVDMTNQFLSLKKKRHVLGKDEYFDNKFDIREFYSRKKQSKYFSEKQKGKKKGGKDEEKLCIEDLQFTPVESLHETSLKHFFDKLKDELKEADWKYLEKKIEGYKKNKIEGGELFGFFVECFGLKDAFHWFLEYMKAVPTEKALYELDGVLKVEAAKLPARYDSLLRGNALYSDLFGKIVKIIAENIFKRFVDGSLTIKNSPRKDQSILFQLLGSLNLMHPKDIIKLKLLPNFLSSEDGADNIEKMIYLDKADAQKYLVVSYYLGRAFIQRHIDELHLLQCCFAQNQQEANQC